MKRLLITLALILVSGLAIIAYRDSQIPRATATVKVHPSIIPTSYMENEYKFILSKETLTIAADLLEIEKNQQPEAIPKMKNSVVTAPIRGSDFITITAKYPDRQQAIDTANAIADAYAQRRKNSEETRAKRAIQALDEELLPHEARVADLWQKVEVAFQKGTIPPFHKEEGETHPIGLFRDFSPPDPLKEEYKHARDFLREVKINQQEARTLLKQPHLPITIHKRAE